ncbi:MAG: T9SS type A sorting domain-containing protein [Bacteroidales bacterium]
MLKKLPVVLSCLLVWGVAFSASAQQQVVASSGGEGAAAGVNLQWTLGESVIHSSGVVAGAQISQGFQQPAYEVKTLTEAPELSFSVDVFPMPASDYLTIKVGSGGLSDLKTVLYDMNGKIVFQQEIGIDENRVDLKGFAPASYILHITDKSGKILKSFKIIKQ